MITGAGSDLGNGGDLRSRGGERRLRRYRRAERRGCRARDCDAGGVASGIHVDVTDRASVQDMVAKSIEIYGQVSCLTVRALPSNAPSFWRSTTTCGTAPTT